MTYNGDCSVAGCYREAVDSSGLCKCHKAPFASKASTAPKHNIVTVDSTDLDKLRVRVAELSEFEPCNVTDCDCGLWFKGSEEFRFNDLPDYPRDLNACAAMEATIPPERLYDWAYHCYMEARGNHRDKDIAMLKITGPQRCLAFVATMEASGPTLGADSVPSEEENL